MTLSLTLHPFSLPLVHPFRTARGALATRAGWLVRATSDAGTGWGEAAPLPSAGTEDAATCHAALTEAARVVNARGEALILEELDEACPVLADAPAARHAMALALLDHATRTYGMRLADVLAAPRAPRERVPVNAVVGLDDDVAEAARAAVSSGYGTLKLKVDADVDAAIARVAAARDATGPNVALRVDANGAWTREGARRALDALAPLDVQYVEQPLPPDDVDGAAALADGAPVRIAADEAVTGVDAARALLEAKAAHVLIVKPLVVGGPDRALAIAEHAAERDVPVVVTTTLDAAVGRAGARHVAAAAPGDVLACGLATGPLLARDVAEPERVEDGHLALSRAPGLGVDPREVAPPE